MGVTDWAHGLRSTARAARRRLDKSGRRQSDTSLVAQADDYWSNTSGPHWQSDSHWRDALDATWDRIGAHQLAICQDLVRVTGRPFPTGRVVEWGVGGGANAVHFAPLADEFVAVDVVRASLDECRRQVAAVTSTPVLPVQIDVGAPESALDAVGRGTCAFFACLYVFELLPSSAYAWRIVDIARDLLEPGGMAVIQIKYQTTDPTSRSRRRAYRRDLANMTTFPVDEFWQKLADHGLRPHAVRIVPQDEVDGRYAYFIATKD